jgi:ribonuclease D
LSGDNKVTLITDAAGVAAWADAIARAPWIALDSESNSMFVYRERVCLLQLNVAGALVVVDPLALAPTIGAAGLSVLAPWKAGLERRDRPLYLHGGEYDVAVVERDFGIALGGVYDTQQAASLLGDAKTSYGTLVESCCGVVLKKAYATYDWATRPLDDGAFAYAVDDVVYLPAVAEVVRGRVAAAGIDDEVAIANAAVADKRWTQAFDVERFWRLRDAEHMDDRATAALRRLFAWRDGAGKQEDLPPGRFMNDEVLLWLARHRPTTRAALAGSRVKGRIVDVHGDGIVAAIVAAEGDPAPRRSRPERAPPEIHAREERLKAWRRNECERRTAAEGRAIPPALVLPPRALAHLATHGAAAFDGDVDAIPAFGASRRARYGDALRAVCAG